MILLLHGDNFLRHNCLFTIAKCDSTQLSFEVWVIFHCNLCPGSVDGIVNAKWAGTSFKSRWYNNMDALQLLIIIALSVLQLTIISIDTNKPIK